ncbi:MAG: hypothetical protein WD077_04155 [Bacteroidia bacterium]
MKQITLNIPDNRFQFFMELIKSLGFVQLEDDGDSDKAIRENIKEGLEEVKLAKEGKLKTISAKQFLDEL